MSKDITLGYLIQRFFTERLVEQRNASQNTINSYRDVWRLFLKYISENEKRNVCTISIEDVNSSTILDFLQHLENVRNCSIRSRNQRLAAFKSFFKYAIFIEPSLLMHGERVLMIPSKVYERKMLGYLTKTEVGAISSSFNQNSNTGRKAYIIFQFMYNTGARVSEVTTVRVCDLKISTGISHVIIHGKGSKDRIVPIWDDTVKLIMELITNFDSSSKEPVFKNRNGNPITRSGIRYMLDKAVKKAAINCKSLKTKIVSPHTIRYPNYSEIQTLHRKANKPLKYP